jgi:hypothetical protein
MPDPKAARRIQLQRSPQLLASLLQGPISTGTCLLQYGTHHTQEGKRAKGLAMVALKKALAQTGSLHTRRTHIARAMIRALKAAGAHSHPYPLSKKKEPGEKLDAFMAFLVATIQKFPPTPWHLNKHDYVLALEIIATTIQVANDFWLIATEDQAAQIKPIVPIIRAYIAPMGTA